MEDKNNEVEELDINELKRVLGGATISPTVLGRPLTPTLVRPTLRPGLIGGVSLDRFRVFTQNSGWQ